MFRKKNLPVFFFAIYLVVGLTCYKDYSVPRDEEWQRKVAYVNEKYVLDLVGIDFEKKFPESKNLPALKEFDCRFYGPLFEAFISVFEQLSGYSANDQGIRHIRHLIMFLFFYISMIYYYKINQILFKKMAISLFSTAAFILYPKFFAESFYNTKDMLFMSIMIVSSFYLLKIILQPSLKNKILFSVFGGIAISIRMIGVILPLFFVIYSIFKLIEKPNKIQWLIEFLGVIGLLVLVVYISIPYLWTSPFTNLMETIHTFSHYTEGSVFEILFGKIILVEELPWYFLPLWILISIPILYILGLFAGTFFLIKEGIKIRHIQQIEDFSPMLFFLYLFYGPIVAVILFRPILYDGWRHFYFLFFPLMILSTFGIAEIYRTLKTNVGKRIILAIISIQFVFLAVWNIKSHPYQFAYFNSFAWKKQAIIDNFVIDYFSLTSYDAMVHILETDTASSIPVYFQSRFYENNTLNQNYYYLTDEERSRIYGVKNLDDAKYVITEYPKVLDLNNFEIFYSLKVGKQPIMKIFKQKDQFKE